MVRDLFMAAVGAASLLGIFAVIMIVVKARERAELRHRSSIGVDDSDQWGS